MSDFTIKDGTGQGYRAKVNNNNRLLTTANTQSTISAVSNEFGQAFSFSALEKAVVANTEYHLLWIKNTNPNNNFLINRVVVSYNGGNTNHNRVVTGRFRLGSIPPSANFTSIPGGALNQSKNANIPLAEAYVWNGTGSGMTITSSGPIALSGYFRQGFTDIVYDGTFSLGYNNVIDLTMTAEEDGLVSLVVTGWYDVL